MTIGYTDLEGETLYRVGDFLEEQLQLAVDKKQWEFAYRLQTLAREFDASFLLEPIDFTDTAETHLNVLQNRFGLEIKELDDK